MTHAACECGRNFVDEQARARHADRDHPQAPLAIVSDDPAAVGTYVLPMWFAEERPEHDDFMQHRELPIEDARRVLVTLLQLALDGIRFEQIDKVRSVLVEAAARGEIGYDPATDMAWSLATWSANERTHDHSPSTHGLS